MNIYKRIHTELNRLGLDNLNSRPYDCAHSVIEQPRINKKLIVVGFNGSDADLVWTNKKAILHGENNPNISNVIHGANGGWLSTTLPKRLLDLSEELGFVADSTIYTNAVLLCSENAHAIKKKAKAVGFCGVNELIEKSLDFFENITVKESMPDLIVAYSNSMNDISAASVLFERFSVTDMSITNHSNYYKTFSFTAEIDSRKIPVVCIRHLSRFKPCLNSIKSAWEIQKKKNMVHDLLIEAPLTNEENKMIPSENSKVLDENAFLTKDKSGFEVFIALLGRKEDSVFQKGKARSFHLGKYNLHSKINYVDIVENKTGFNIQIYFNKSMESMLDTIATAAKNSTSVGYINNNRDYISSKNCTEKTALEFLAFMLDY